MNNILIRNGRVIDPSQDIDQKYHLLIHDGTIQEFIEPERSVPETETEIDASGFIVAPGFIDMHTHLREPGDEEAETIGSGAEAAVAGGFTTIAAMPNTDPPIDNEANAEYVILQGKRKGLANVHPIGAVTMGRDGEKLAELGQLLRGGAVAFSDDGNPVKNANIMRNALQYAKMFDKPIINHAENLSLSDDGIMNAGKTSEQLGFGGIPSVSEEIMVHRDITLADTTGGHVHIAHVSTKESVEAIRKGKEKGVRVTAEVTPHHFSLTEKRVETFDPDYKMKPPLRTEEDVQAIKEGLSDGTIDAIATDHAPHAETPRDVQFSSASFGVIGLESALPIVEKELIEPGKLSWKEAISKMSSRPAEILNLNRGTLAEGSPADVVIFDPEECWTIQPEQFSSRSKNCPFKDWDVRGNVKEVFVDGRHVYSDSE